MASGAWSGSTASPYGLSDDFSYNKVYTELIYNTYEKLVFGLITFGTCIRLCISNRDFSVQALSTLSVRPAIS